MEEHFKKLFIYTLEFSAKDLYGKTIEEANRFVKKYNKKYWVQANSFWSSEDPYRIEVYTKDNIIYCSKEEIYFNQHMCI